MMVIRDMVGGLSRTPLAAEEDVRPWEKDQVERQHDEACHDDHGGRAPPALEIGDGAVQGGKRHVGGEPERQRVRDEHQKDGGSGRR